MHPYLATNGLIQADLSHGGRLACHVYRGANWLAHMRENVGE